MNRHHITLSEPVSKVLRAQVKRGRYKDFSAAIQDAAWHYFIGQPSLFEEYGVTEEEVEKAAVRDLDEIRRDRKAGKLKPWKP
jgi:hypothetical protein